MPLYETDSKPAKKLDKIIKRLKKCVKSDEHNRKEAIEDLKFLNGEQWDAMEKKRRGLSGRPALQVNLLDKFVDQVTGDARHNRPRIKVRPSSDDAEVQIALIREGIIMDIENQSNSEVIYDQALEMSTSCGYGAWRILTRECEENPFQQEAYLEYIENPLLVYLDPAAKDPAGMDAKYGFILQKMTKGDFEDEYPDALWPVDALKTGLGLADEHWYEDDLITVAEYFEVTEEDEEMHLLTDGRVVNDEDWKEIKKEYKDKKAKAEEQMQQMMSMNPLLAQPHPQGLPVPGAPPTLPMPNVLAQIGEKPEIDETKSAKVRKVKQYLLTAWEFLNDNDYKGEDFPGKHVPVVQVRGKQRNIEGKRYVRGLIRNAKDPQKMFNYWTTAAAEVVALAPKAPWLGTAKMFENYEHDYAAANVENFPYLKYNIDPENPQGHPERQGMGQAPTAIFTQMNMAQDNIKAAIGMFNADIGQGGSEQTGAAINSRQRPGDIATFQYQDNLARAIRLTGVILNNIISEIYDTERDVRVKAFDGTETFVPINTTLDKALEKMKKNKERYGGLDPNQLTRSNMYQNARYVKYNALGTGRYDVVVKTGPSYATQRQESQQALMNLTQSMPDVMKNAADLIVRNMDFKDAEEMARRLEKGLPPGMAPVHPGEAQAPQPPPNPQLMLAQAKLQGEQNKQQLLQIKSEQEKAKIQLEREKIEHEKIRTQLEMEKLKVAQAEAGKENPMENKETLLKLRMENERLQLEVAKFKHQREMDHAKFDHGRKKDAVELSNTAKKTEADITSGIMDSMQPIVEAAFGGDDDTTAS